MQPLSSFLKFKLILLALIFPLSFFGLGWFVGMVMHNSSLTLIFSIIGLALGIFLNLVCFYRKLFTVVLYQTPIPLALFLLTWWISNSFTDDLFALFIGLGGLLVGLWLNQILVLPYQFYRIRKRVLAIIYLFFSVACLGFFMGIPVFNLLLGILAGNYLSIRVLRYFKSQEIMTRNLRQGAMYTAVVLFFITLFAAIVAISDYNNSIQLASQVLQYSFDKLQFYLLIIVGGLVIVFLQYFITFYTAQTMLQIWLHRRSTK